MSNFPPGWRAYLASAGGTPGRGVALFAARFRLASNVESISLTGYSATTARGYTALMRVALAYSAYEALVRAKAPGVSMNNVVENPVIAAQLRSKSLDKLLSSVARDTRSDTLAKRVARFQSGEYGNLVTVAEGIRHLVFHGETSVATSGIRSIAAADALGQLADALLDHCGEAFNSLAEDGGFNRPQV